MTFEKAYELANYWFRLAMEAEGKSGRDSADFTHAYNKWNYYYEMMPLLRLTPTQQLCLVAQQLKEDTK